MKTAMVELVGIAPLSFSKYHSEPQFEGESPDVYDRRTWRDKAHTHGNGQVYIPGVSLAKALVATAKQLGEKVLGRGAKRWGSIFQSGLLVPSPIDLMVPKGKAADRISAKDCIPVMKDQLEYVDVYCDAQGRPGTGRVWRRFPIIGPPWFGIAEIIITNDDISEPVLRRHVERCGAINGVGRYRVANGGEFGRFAVQTFDWLDEAKLRTARKADEPKPEDLEAAE